MIELRKERRVGDNMVNLGIAFTDPSVELEQVSRHYEHRKTINVNVSATRVAIYAWSDFF